MKTLAAVAVLNALLLVVGPLALGKAGALFAEQSRHVPAICMDSSPVVIGEVGEFRRTPDDIECRPGEMTFGRNFEE